MAESLAVRLEDKALVSQKDAAPVLEAQKLLFLM